ncbi:YycH family regulatory protein [Bacillus methanolicus]|uniref:YycH family protein n=1 Tax=Bacillus methanolicus (strain MGA3 / ATCC 53907) TaxID=796606 RepID=I3EBX2_BACMM|nr:two-component system activity regulator YycH [Bacillus methanolicus]AIE61671.1 YycH family protein [Bacillus methanolicus MGA3]EIJ83993.1 YycH family protein [Bacillus methanolicus MGA3]
MTYENIKSAILMVLVILSVVLTWNIWTYQPNFDTMEKSNYIGEVEIGAKKEVNKVVKPDRILFHYQGNHYGTVSNAYIDKIIRELSTWSFYGIKNITNQIHQLPEFVHADGNVEIVFPDVVPIELYKTVLSIEDRNLPKFKFNRIVIDADNKEGEDGIVYFVRYGTKEEQQVYVSHVSSAHLKEFNQKFYKQSNQYPRYFEYKATNYRSIFLPVEKPKMKKYKYYSYNLSSEKFAEALFHDPRFVQKNVGPGKEEYIGESSMMTVDNDMKMLSFVNPQEESEYLKGPVDLLQRSIDYINAHGGWTDSYRYAGMDEINQKVIFRLYDLEGYPVFNENGLSELELIWGQNDIYRYFRPNFGLDVPLNNEISEVVLDSGQEALEFLQKSKGFKPEKLQDMVIGYRISIDQQSSRHLVFTPYWYYKYDNAWGRIVKDERGGVKLGLE